MPKKIDPAERKRRKAAATAAWAARNREHVREKYREWIKNHPEKRRHYARQNYARNKAKFNAKSRAWHRAHPNYAPAWQRAHQTILNERAMTPDNVKRRRERKLRRKYGITQDQFLMMYLSQVGLCAICTKPMTVEPHKTNTAVVDHNHDTGKVRGLLCDLCNLGLGRFKDDVQLLHAAISYLTTHDDHSGR